LEQLDGVIDVFHSINGESRAEMLKTFSSNSSVHRDMRDAYYNDIYTKNKDKVIKTLRDAGYNVDDKGKLTLDIKGDGVFRVPVDRIDSFTAKVRKEYPEKTKEIKYPKQFKGEVVVESQIDSEYYKRRVSELKESVSAANERFLNAQEQYDKKSSSKYWFEKLRDLEKQRPQNEEAIKKATEDYDLFRGGEIRDLEDAKKRLADLKALLEKYQGNEKNIQFIQRDAAYFEKKIEEHKKNETWVNESLEAATESKNKESISKRYKEKLEKAKKGGNEKYIKEAQDLYELTLKSENDSYANAKERKDKYEATLKALETARDTASGKTVDKPVTAPPKESKTSSLPETPKAVEGGREKTAPEPSQSIPLVKKYAELMAEKQIKSELEGAKERNIEVTKEKLAEATAKTIKQNENQFNKLKDAIDGKDLKKLQDSLHLGNKNWRKFFEEYTGISLGKTMRETKEALKDFVETGTHTSGPKAEDFYITNTDDKGKRTFIKVSGKPVTLKYKGDYFISKPPGSKEFVLSEARTGTAVGRGATKEEAIKAAEHDIEVYGGQKTIDKNIENLISKHGLSPRYEQKPKVEKPYAEMQEEQLRAKIVDATKELRAAEEKLKAIGKHHWQDGLRERAQNDVDEFKENVAKLEKNLLEIIKKKDAPAISKPENDRKTEYGAVEHIKSLDENEENNTDGGYKYGNARDRLATIKEELISNPKKAKLTLDVIDFTKKLDNVDSAWENDLGMIATAYSGLDGSNTLADYANKLVANLQNKIAKNQKSAEIQTDKSIKKTLLGYVERDKKELTHLEETIQKEVPGYKELTPSPPKTIEHFRIGKSPQLYVKVRELPFDAKTDAEGEKYFEVKNETTGEVSTVEQVI
jgi:hypothetical protein